MVDEMRSVFTNAGIALAEQALAGKAQIAFTRGVASVADWSARDPADLKEVTKLDDETQVTGIGGVATIDEGGGTINASQIDITLIFNQANVMADYDMRTVGLFAAPIVDGKRGAEVLYTITTFDQPQWMSKSVNGNSVTLKIATVVGDTAQLTITLSSPTGDTGGLTQGQLDIFKLNLDKEYDGKYADKAAFDALMARIGGGDSDDAIVTTSSMTQYLADHKADFKGDKGDQGIQGLQGPQGVPGPQGDPGNPGVQGKQGPQGVPGVGAYTDYKNNGGTGTFDQFLATLKGAKGDKGDTGATGTTGPTGATGPAGKDAPADAITAQQFASALGFKKAAFMKQTDYDALATKDPDTAYVTSFDS